MKFNYQARTKQGEVQAGIVEAASQEAAINLLRSYGLYVTSLEEALPPFYARSIKFFGRISKKEVVSFSRQLAIMFKAEISLVEIFYTLAKQTKNPFFKEKILEMAKRIEGGDSLSKTFSSYPGIFSQFYVNMVKAGEASGKLSETFSYLADYLEREHNFSSKLKSALIYPIFLSVVFLGVIGILIYFVIPKINEMIEETNAELPAITKILLGTSYFFKDWWWIILLIVAFFTVLIVLYRRTEEGKAFFDEFLLKIPALGSFLKKIYLSRLALNLSTLISGGLPIVRSLEITSDTLGNEVYKSIALKVAEGVKRGARMSDLFETYPQYVPSLFTQLVFVGEKTGRLDESLKSIVDFYQNETEKALGDFMALLEPILIVVFGVLVGGLVASVLLPIYQTISAF